MITATFGPGTTLVHFVMALLSQVLEARIGVGPMYKGFADLCD